MKPSDDKTIFYLIRHGEAENNVRHILCSWPDKGKYPLTETGRKQIEKVATNDLSEVIPDVIFSSPIARTRETAEIIARAAGAQIFFDERLRETDFGVFDNGPVSDLLAKYPDPATRIETDGSDGVESFIGMRKRLKNFLDDIREQYTGKTVVIVSHGDPLEQLHGILTDESPGVSSNGWYPKKGSCTKIRANF